MTRLILELGAGNDLYGEDYTKAACRAVQDALHHSSLTLFRTLNLSHGDMQVNVTIGVQRPSVWRLLWWLPNCPVARPLLRWCTGDRM